MRIYVASSWRNTRQPAVVEVLRKHGHEVYDFRHPIAGDEGFSWRQVTDVPKEQWSPSHYRDEVLKHPIARRGFNLDMQALVSCDACVLVLPCGRSAHLELGYAVGANKRTYVLLDEFIDEPELMYLMCSGLVLDTAELVDKLGVGTEDMSAHSTDREWKFVVPPANTTRVVISQRQDGPFRGNSDSNGHFYVSIERLELGRWSHVAGSTQSGIKSLGEAKSAAARLWRGLRAEALAVKP